MSFFVGWKLRFFPWIYNHFLLVSKATLVVWIYIVAFLFQTDPRTVRSLLLHVPKPLLLMETRWFSQNNLHLPPKRATLNFFSRNRWNIQNWALVLKTSSSSLCVESVTSFQVFTVQLWGHLFWLRFKSLFFPSHLEAKAARSSSWQDSSSFPLLDPGLVTHEKAQGPGSLEAHTPVLLGVLCS